MKTLAKFANKMRTLMRTVILIEDGLVEGPFASSPSGEYERPRALELTSANQKHTLIIEYSTTPGVRCHMTRHPEPGQTINPAPGA